VSAGFEWIESVVCELSVDPPSDFRCNVTTEALIFSPALTNATTLTALPASPLTFKSSVPPTLAIFLFAGAVLLVLGRVIKQIRQKQSVKEERMKLVKARQQTYDSTC